MPESKHQSSTSSTYLIVCLSGLYLTSDVVTSRIYVKERQICNMSEAVCLSDRLDGDLPLQKLAPLNQRCIPRGILSYQPFGSEFVSP